MNIAIIIFAVTFVSQQIIVESASYSSYINDTTIPLEKSLLLLSPTQRRQVEEFKLKNVNILTDDYLRSDSHVIGWLRGNKWDIPLATKALRRTLAWRIANKIDQLGEEDSPPEMQELFPYRVVSRDENGCAVLEIEFGQWNVASYMASVEFIRDGVKNFQRHVTQMWEKARKAIKENAKECDQCIHLEDETGFSMKNLADPNALAGIINAVLIYETHYPNIFKEIHLGNAPPDFADLMTILKASFSSGTFNILKIYGNHELDEFINNVLSNIDPIDLPPMYGGVRLKDA